MDWQPHITSTDHTESGSSSDKDEAEELWTCTTCTLLNACYQESCEACGEAKPKVNHESHTGNCIFEVVTRCQLVPQEEAKDGPSRRELTADLDAVQQRMESEIDTLADKLFDCMDLDGSGHLSAQEVAKFASLVTHNNDTISR